MFLYFDCTHIQRYYIVTRAPHTQYFQWCILFSAYYTLFCVRTWYFTLDCPYCTTTLVRLLQVLCCIIVGTKSDPLMLFSARFILIALFYALIHTQLLASCIPYFYFQYILNSLFTEIQRMRIAKLTSLSTIFFHWYLSGAQKIQFCKIQRYNRITVKR